MQQTYNDAIAQVFKDEGGYSNTPGDHGGPTNWGITLQDARQYWKPNATADDVKNMPKAVASDIYQKHYAEAIGYDKLPAGVDYALLDYSVNSGIGRALAVYRTRKTIDAIYDEREAFLKVIATHPGQAKFLNGWLSRTRRGRQLAHALETKYGKSTSSSKTVAAGGILVTGAVAATQTPTHVWPWVIAGTIVIAIITGLYIHYTEKV